MDIFKQSWTRVQQTRSYYWVTYILDTEEETELVGP